MNLFQRPSDSFRVSPEFQPVVRLIGLDAHGVFRDPRIKVWRKLSDRENCTLDADLGDGTPARFHVKRYEPVNSVETPAEEEFAGYQSLVYEKIPTAPLIAWGTLKDRRSFTIWQHLVGFTAGDKWMQTGQAFERILTPTAELAAKLHRSNLHHRDLYLCHFMIKPGADDANDEVRLIDTARVRRLPGFLTRKRWIIKDLAQFWYSTTKHPEITDEQRERWLARYAEVRGDVTPNRLRSAIDRKVRAIARHDAHLKQSQPNRNVSIPT